MKLGVLDFHFPQWTIALAPEAEQLGYHRYWVGEHYGEGARSASPAIMTGVVAALTSRMRVGPAGVLLPYVAPYKVAQDHRLLETLYGDRIDLGVARGPGGKPEVVEALRDGRPADGPDFDARVHELSAILHGTLPAQHPLAHTPTVGEAAPPSEFWVLGATERGARLAGAVGASFAFSEYIARMMAPDVDGGAIVRAYRDAFVPSASLATPRCAVAVLGVGLAQADIVPEIAQPSAGPPPLLGTVSAWRDEFQRLADTYETDDVVLNELSRDFDDCRRSLAVFAEAAALAAVA